MMRAIQPASFFVGSIVSMDHPGFWEVSAPVTLDRIIQHTDSQITEPFKPRLSDTFKAVKPLDVASSADISFFDNRKYMQALQVTQAGAVFLQEKFASRLIENVIPLTSRDPYRSFAKALELFYPDALYTKAAMRSYEDGPIASNAEIEDGAIIEPGAIIGAEAQIGRGTHIAAGAVIGYRTAIGRDCYIGSNATVTHSLIGNRVIIHGGARIGQDGFGFAMGPRGHYKVRQIGRVIIQDDVEIGANTTIDRGALRDTVIGEGSKIDNLVQIAHNVMIGRHCVIAAQTGISGSTILEDFVAMGGQCGTVGHIRIGMGAQIGAQSGVSCDIPPGSRWAGYPAKPATSWAREVAYLKRMTNRRNAHLQDVEES